MPHRVVYGESYLFYRGVLRQVGSQPDGDSVWIRPQTARLLKCLYGRNARFHNGHAEAIRLNGIEPDLAIPPVVILSA
jgi:hypothetical protein